MTAADWAEANAHAKQIWRDEAIKQMHDRLMRRRAAEATTAAKAKLVTSGPGWRVLDKSYTELEDYARRVWEFASKDPQGPFYRLPFPRGYRVRWGALPQWRGCQMGGSMKLILLDQEVDRHWRGPRDFTRTIIHEFLHIVRPRDDHSSEFGRIVEKMLEFVMPADDAATSLRVPIPQRLVDTQALVDATKGRQFTGAGRWSAPVPGSADWEYR
jgi:hypothetical protein